MEPFILIDIRLRTRKKKTVSIFIKICKRHDVESIPVFYHIWARTQFGTGKYCLS